MSGGTIFSLLLLFGIAAYAVVMQWDEIQHWRRGNLSISWPLTSASIEFSNISEVVVADGEGTPHRYWQLVVAFSYVVNGDRFGGMYEELFAFSQVATLATLRLTDDTPTDNAAERSLASYRQLPFLVRYNPDSPAEYFIDPLRDVRIS